MPIVRSNRFAAILATALLVPALLMTPAAAGAQNNGGQTESGDPLARAEEAILETLRQALGLASSLGTLVPYEMPETLPNGDIIIRRKQPEAPSAQEPETEGRDGPIRL